MVNKKKILVGVAGLLLLAGGIGASLAATDEGRGGGWRGHGERGGWGQRRAAATPEELDARVREQFARLDRNSDGVIDRAEIEAMLTERHGGRGWFGRRFGGNRDQAGTDQAGGGDRGGRMLRRFDENKDGKVTKEEFLNTIKRRFAEMDLNNDGKITDEDLPPMLRGRGVLTGAAEGPGAGGKSQGRGMGREGGMSRMIGWLRAADTNHDGVITLDEVVAHAEKEFARLDRNRDGVIDKADGELVRKEMTDYGVQRFLHRFGADKDGKVTREQFTKVSKERMARMESDGDGPGSYREGRRHHRGDGGDDAGRGPRRGGRGGPDGRGEPGAEPPAGAPPGPAAPAKP